MNDIIPIFTQHFNTLFSIYASENISTGNRSKDNAILTICVAIFGIFLSYFINLILKGGWQITLRKLGIINRTPTQFSVLSVETPKTFAYTLPFSDDNETNAFCKWMLKHNPEKLKDGGIIVSTSLFSDFEEINDEEEHKINSNHEFWVLRESIREALSLPLPIWLGSDGHFVFVSRGIGVIKNNDKIGAEDCRTFCLSSNSMNAIKEVCKSIYEFEEVKTNKHFDPTRNKLYEVVIPKRETANAKAHPKVLSYINPRKTFNVLHFQQKQELIHLLDNLAQKKIGTIKNGLENKLGILLYGPPGTGKSGVIQAIANYTNRSILMINLSIIRTKEDLDNVFDIKNRSKYIFVFEEIDCMGDVVHKREQSVPKKNDSDSDSDMKEMKEMLMISAMSNMNHSRNGPPKTFGSNKLNIRDVLLKIDGMEDNEDTIFVATTNHIQKLDPAIIRPGRFGFHLNMTYCNKDMIYQIIRMMLNIEDIDELQKLNNSISDKMINVWTSTEVIEFCQIQKNWHLVIDYMLNHTPRKYD